MNSAIFENLARISLHLVAGLGIVFLVSCAKSSDSSEEKFDVVQEVTYSFRLQKKPSGSGEAVANLYLPVTQEGRQKLLSYSLSGTINHKPQLINDELGNQYLRYELADTPQNFVGTVKVKARVGSYLPQLPADNSDLKDAPERKANSENQAFLSDIDQLINESRKQSLTRTENTTCTSLAQDVLAAAKDYNMNSEAIVGIARDNKQDAVLTCWVQLFQEENNVLINLADGEFIAGRETGIRAFKNLQDAESIPLKNLLAVVYGLSVDVSFEK